MIEENAFGVDGEMLLSSGLSVADNGNVFVIGNVACPSGQCGALVRLSGGLVEVGNVSYDAGQSHQNLSSLAQMDLRFDPGRDL
jgi:hypothetical protein